MSNFAKTTCYFSPNWPIEFSFHRVKPGAGGNLGSEFVVTLPLWLKSPAVLQA